MFIFILFRLYVQIQLQKKKHVLVQRFKKIEMDEKVAFNKDIELLQNKQIPLKEWFSEEFLLS